jgi:hypothetical protein
MENKIINLNFNLKDLDGNDLNPEQNAGKIVARSLVVQPKGDAVKFYHWAISLHRGESVSLDFSDLEVLRNWIKNTDAIFVIAKAQILEYLFTV